MEIRINRDVLYRAVSRVQSIVEKRSNMPILSTVLLSASASNVQISATDLELAFQDELPAEVIEEGAITISGRKLFEIVKESKATEIHIKEQEDHWVLVSDQVARFNLACLAPDDYPILGEPEGVSMIEIDGTALSEMINKTIYSVTIEEAGFKLSGVFTEKLSQEGKTALRMVATDGHRLSMVDKFLETLDALELSRGVMIPKKGLLELNKFSNEGGSIRLGFKQNHCVAKKGNALLVIRLLEAKFPDYQAVIPKKIKYHIPIDRMTLLEAMRKMLILSTEHYRAVKITLTQEGMELVSTNPDLGEARETISLKYEGETQEFGFNPRYFIDALQAMESETVVLGFIDNSKPCLISGEADPGFLGLIMPMRL